MADEHEVTHGDILHKIGVIEGRVDGVIRTVDVVAKTVTDNRTELHREVQSIRTSIEAALESHKATVQGISADTTARLNATETRLTLILGGLILVGALLPMGWSVFERGVLDAMPNKSSLPIAPLSVRGR